MASYTSATDVIEPILRKELFRELEELNYMESHLVNIN